MMLLPMADSLAGTRMVLLFIVICLFLRIYNNICSVTCRGLGSQPQQTPKAPFAKSPLGGRNEQES
jgi:hypothetical protein